MQAFAKTVLEFMRDRFQVASSDPVIAAASTPMTERQASMLVGDVVEWSQDLAGDDLSALNDRLAERGLPTLTLVRRRQDREFATLLSNGRITSDDEYRSVAARLSDVESPLSDQDRALASQMLAHYENEKTV